MRIAEVPLPFIYSGYIHIVHIKVALDSQMCWVFVKILENQNCTMK